MRAVALSRMASGRKVKKTLLYAVLISALGIAAYLNSFSVPFQFDDAFYITANPAIANPSMFVTPSKMQGHMLHHYLLNRYVGFVTLWANFALGGLNPVGYHVFNLAVHIASALLLYALMLCAFNAPRMQGVLEPEAARMAALGAALLFVAHPIQTQAVTYISQRFTSLAAMFYIASLASYACARIGGKRSLFALAFVLGALAMKTKEISLTLPFAIALYEFMLHDGPLKARLKTLLPYMALVLIVPLTVLMLEKPFSDLMGDLMERSRADSSVPRTWYLMTQFVVIVKYLGLVLWPAGLNIDHDIPVYTALTQTPVYASIMGLMAFVGLGLWAARRLPVAQFGLIFFFLALSVESSVIPIRDVMFEHRMYLPMAGLMMFASALAFKYIPRRVALSALVGLALILSAATFARNITWQSSIALWKDATVKSPRKPRTFTNLAFAYSSAADKQQAEQYYRRAIEIEPGYSRAWDGLGTVHFAMNKLEQAEEDFKRAIKTNPENDDAFFNLGSIYYLRGLYPEAISNYRAALALEPLDAVAEVNLGRAYQASGDNASAISAYRRAKAISPGVKLPNDAYKLLQ